MFFRFSATAASNGNSDPTINFLERQAPSTVNDSARALMARMRVFSDGLGGALTYGGTGDAYTIASPAGHTYPSYQTGQVLTLVPNAANTGAVTVAIDGLSAVGVRDMGGGALASGDLVSGGRYPMAYDSVGGYFRLMVPVASDFAFQPLDATLTAVGGLTITADTIVYGTGSDTVALTTLTSFARTLLDDADAAAARSTLGITGSSEVALAAAAGAI